LTDTIKLKQEINEMTTETNSNSVETRKTEPKWVAGAMLILIGVLVLLAQFVDFSAWLVLPCLAVIFLAWGLLTRKNGLIIPGGVIAGVGLGAYLAEGPFVHVADPAKGGIVLLAMASGWVLISLFSLFTESPRKLMLWPLIPGGIMAAIGGLLIAGGTGLKVLEYAGYGWPVILIALGAYLILRRK